VTDVVKSGETYDPDANDVTKACESGPVFKQITGLVPSRLALTNYPNPFNPTTGISFSLPAAADVRLDIFNIMGQRIATLVDGTLNAGVHTFAWDGANLASGVYMYRLTAGDLIETRKMMLLK